MIYLCKQPLQVVQKITRGSKMVTVLLNLNCTTQTYSTVRDINALFHDLGHREIGRPFVIEKTVRKTRSEKNDHKTKCKR